MELIHQKEMEKANIENELASIRVNTLNTEAHNAALRDNLKKVCRLELKCCSPFFSFFLLQLLSRCLFD